MNKFEGSPNSQILEFIENDISDEVIHDIRSALSISSLHQPCDIDFDNMDSLNFNPVQINGRKVLGPPSDWIGPPPSNRCELFIKRIPRDYSEMLLISHFQRFGQIYEFRLMMDFHERNRGYAYVKYTCEEDAAKAKEIMNHFYITPRKCLEIQYSYDKCRLFVGNIPKELTREEIEKGFRECFPNIKEIVLHKRICDGVQNRGFAFLDFSSHQDALEVKKMTTPGRIRKWGRDLKIVWANQERYIDPELQKNIKTLFVRNVDLSVNIRDIVSLLTTVVQKFDVKKISKVREFAFIEFSTRTAAEKILEIFQGHELKGYKLNIEWALPPSENSCHKLQHIDFDAILRLKCIANYWNFPIILFGRVFESDNLQYAAVMLRDATNIRAIFVELKTDNLVDIQSRLCEVIVSLIEQTGGMPLLNYVIKVVDDIVHIVGVITNFEYATFIKAHGIYTNLTIYWNEIYDLSMAIHYLSLYTQEQLILMYNDSLKNIKINNFSYLENIFVNERLFGCLNSKYRNKEPLKYNIDNTQIIFVLCNTYSLTNYIFDNIQTISYSLQDNNNSNIFNNNNEQYKIDYCINHLLPLRFIQSRLTDFKMNTVYFGKRNHNIYYDLNETNLIHSQYNYNYQLTNFNDIQLQNDYLNCLYGLGNLLI